MKRLLVIKFVVGALLIMGVSTFSGCSVLLSKDGGKSNKKEQVDKNNSKKDLKKSEKKRK